MYTKKKILLSVIVATLTVAYTIATLKIGPCSPELELLINKK